MSIRTTVARCLGMLCAVGIALGPTRLCALCRLPNQHIEKKALARRAALSAMTVDEIHAEIDGLLGVAPTPAGPTSRPTTSRSPTRSTCSSTR
jgi:hypothetical protein